MQTQNLQIIPRGIKPIIKASQFDVGREFQLKLYDGAVAYTPPTGTALRLDGVKPDGTVFSYTENLSLSGSTITVTTTTQMTILEGTVQCEIRMTKDNDDIGTINFDLMVEKSPINETTDLSQTEIPALVTLARMQMENAEAWAVGTKDGEPVSPDDPQYENSAKYWAQQVGGQTQDAEAWAVGTKDGEPVTSGDPQYHNNAKYYSDGVHTDAQAAAASALVSEGYATGKQNGTDVTSTSPYYHNNAAYFAGEAADNATTAANAALRAEAAVVLEPYIGANGNWYVYDFSTNAYVDTGVDATGATGNGIASIAKTSTSGLVDTYTITYTDNTTTTFTVTNGADGQNGQDGATGNGIASITKTSTSGLVDTYTILYTDGTSTTFTVTNGQNGTGAGDMLAADYDPTQAVYNEGGIAAYVAAQLSGFSTSLSGLSDVALASLATGQSLVYDATSGKWVNGSVSYSNLTNKPTLGTAAAKDSTNAVTNASTDLVESGAVYTELGTKVNKTDIAPVEDTPTASRQYVAGEKFYFNGVLKEATATIAQGGTITPGTNCSDAPKVTAEIQTLTNQVSDISDEIADMNNILGAKNLLPNEATTQTINGVTFTANADGTVTVNGTATVDTYYEVQYQSFKLPNKSLILSGCPSGGSALTYNLHVRSAESDSSQWQYYIDYGDSTSFVADNNRVYVCNIGVMQGQTVSNLVFKPMLRPASIQDDTYTPYSMTNREMTPYVQAISNPNLLDNPWFTVNQRGQSSYTIGTGNTTTLDRWTAFKGANGSMSVEVNNGAKITVSSDASDNAFRERIGIDEFNFLVGKTVTLSILMDGTVYSVTGKVLERAASWQTSFKRILDNGLTIELAISPSSNTTYAAEIDFRAPKDGNSYTIRAAKLELGSVSTLASDTVPNYQQELAKCQRYFNRIGHASEYVGVGVGQAWTDNVACIHVPLSVPMRAKPSVTQSGSGYANLRNQQTVVGTVNSYTVDGVGQNEIMLRLGTSNTPLTAGLVYEAFLAGGRYIDLSADF